jgi:hypothetical protein
METIFRLSEQYALLLDKNESQIPKGGDQPGTDYVIEPIVEESMYRT